MGLLEKLGEGKNTHPEGCELCYKFLKAVAIKRKEWVDVLTRVGFSREVILDEGPNLIGKVFQQLWKLLGGHPSIWWCTTLKPIE